MTNYLPKDLNVFNFDLLVIIMCVFSEGGMKFRIELQFRIELLKGGNNKGRSQASPGKLNQLNQRLSHLHVAWNYHMMPYLSLSFFFNYQRQ